IRVAQPRGQDKLNEPARSHSLRELVEADPRIDFPCDVRRHRASDLRRFAGVTEAPHQLDLGRLRGHARRAYHPGLPHTAAPAGWTRPRGLAFKDRNASRRDECILRTLVPRWMTPNESLVSPCITATTSPRSAVATRAAPSRFVAASEEGRSLDRCAPTTTTGAVRSRSMKAKAAVVKCNVSVPCGMTTPAAPDSSSFAASRARRCQFSGFRFSL